MTVEYIWGLGRRKTSTARVRIRPGAGNFMVNGKKFNEYFCTDEERRNATMPLKALDIDNVYDIWVNVRGGGPNSQAGAVLMGLARALSKANEAFTETLKHDRLLTRDSRMKERKKPGQRGARARFQFSKR